MSAATRAPGTVLVTGANSGLGLAIAVELARRGHHVVGTTRSEEKADALRAAAAEAGVEVDTSLLEVAYAGRCAEVVDAVRPRVVVNNAGYALTGPIETEPGFFATATFDELEADERRFGDDRHREAFRRTCQGLERARPLMGDPRDVARTVARAVEISRPRPRYLVGIDAQVLDATRLLTPTAINDRLQRMVTGL